MKLLVSGLFSFVCIYTLFVLCVRILSNCLIRICLLAPADAEDKQTMQIRINLIEKLREELRLQRTAQREHYMAHANCNGMALYYAFLIACTVLECYTSCDLVCAYADKCQYGVLICFELNVKYSAHFSFNWQHLRYWHAVLYQYARNLQAFNYSAPFVYIVRLCTLHLCVCIFIYSLSC
jgi:hypothetical protein